jgi:hypothetical protein
VECLVYNDIYIVTLFWTQLYLLFDFFILITQDLLLSSRTKCECEILHRNSFSLYCLYFENIRNIFMKNSTRMSKKKLFVLKKKGKKCYINEELKKISFLIISCFFLIFADFLNRTSLFFLICLYLSRFFLIYFLFL